MFIKELTARNFRNYGSLAITFTPGINFIIGNNGVGKTNILEAISIASNIKTFRNIHDSELIKWNEDSYYCSAVIGESDDRVFEIGCTLFQDKIKKRLKIDGKEIKSAADYYGRFLTVTLSPIDINIVNGAPEARRRFFDSVISKIDASYFETLNEFKKVLVSRNRILKEIKINNISRNQLDVWDTLFSEKAHSIAGKRYLFIDRFNSVFRNYYGNIAEGDDPPVIEYDCTTGKDDAPAILEKLQKSRSRDILLGSTGIGPQRDDFILENGSGSRFINYASQGQRRTAAVTLKIAECILIEEEKRKKSVILVDDIFSELDEKRRSKMIDILCRGNQIIFTMVHFNPEKLHKFGMYRGYHIEAGGLIKELS
ncbi:MAG TPA: DNA replication and repair protein RecF [Spirochaetota bacterium]|nr:DNA replication and repair protein RecF [Spirochaetota bacterium]